MVDACPEVSRLLLLKECVSDGTEFVVNPLRDFKPVERLQVRRDVMLLGDTADNTGEIVLQVL